MNELPQSLRELSDMQDYVKGRLVDKGDFNEFVKSLVSVWHKLVARIDKSIADINGDISALDSKTNTSLRGLENYLSREITEKNIETKKTIAAEIKKEMARVRDDIDMLRAEIPAMYDDSSIKQDIQSVRASMPKIVTLQEVWDRFAKIEKRIQDIADTKPSVIRQVFGGGRPVHVPMVDDLSTLTDGSTKTFYLSKQPRSLNTIKVWGSDFPHILRSNVDFTITGKLVTLTSEVDAPSSGATLIAEYYI